MRTIETKVFLFNELSDEAKEKAREWFRTGDDLFHWSGEYIDSINTFCEHFRVKLTDWSVEPFGYFNFKTDADNSHFRGLKLKSVNPDHCPTGFCADVTLWSTFYEVFKTKGNALHAFNEALYECFKEWRDDWEYHYSNESIDNNIRLNEYEFLESGRIV